MVQALNVLAQPQPALPSDEAIAQFCLQHDPSPTSVGVSFPLPQGGSVWVKFVELASAQIFHEFEKDGVVYIVMEEIEGETVEQLEGFDVAIERIGRALDEFIRIPPPEGEALGPIDGGVIEHPMFPDVQAATRYESKKALGDHITGIFKLTRDNLNVDFEEDARIIWPADFHDAKFKFVGDKVYWFDYRNVNVLPESFKIHDLIRNSRYWIARNLGRTYLGLHLTTKSDEVNGAPLPYLSRQTGRTTANAVAIQRASLRLWTGGTSSLCLPNAETD
ncbi:hypothetical protein FS837_000901 [Tulasnella sp. UAMH 9824]|nr:hypothetical protein FS837_000901 [Tulasnella sp. UAMH 9824]